MFSGCSSSLPYYYELHFHVVFIVWVTLLFQSAAPWRSSSHHAANFAAGPVPTNIRMLLQLARRGRSSHSRDNDMVFSYEHCGCAPLQSVPRHLQSGSNSLLVWAAERAPIWCNAYYYELQSGRRRRRLLQLSSSWSSDHTHHTIMQAWSTKCNVCHANFRPPTTSS